MERDNVPGICLCYYTIRARGNNSLVPYNSTLRMSTQLRCWLAQIITNNMHKLSTYYVIMTIFIVPIDCKCCPAFNNDCIMFCWLQYLVKSINTLHPIQPYSVITLLRYNLLVCTYQMSMSRASLRYSIGVVRFLNKILLCRSWHHIIWGQLRRLQPNMWAAMTVLSSQIMVVIWMTSPYNQQYLCWAVIWRLWDDISPLHGG